MSENDKDSTPDRRSSSSNHGDEGLDERLERLRSKLENVQPDEKYTENGQNGPQNGRNANGIGQAFRLSSEFIAGIVVGAGIGYLVDTFFGTSPWGMIIFFLLGFAAAVLNVMRAAGMIAESQMRLKPAHEMHNRPQDDEIDDQAKK